MSEMIYRPGLENIIAGETAISTIAGGLSYRGYSIEDLAENASFEEVAHLILHAELPTAPQLDDFRKRLAQGATVDQQVVESLGSETLLVKLLFDRLLAFPRAEGAPQTKGARMTGHGIRSHAVAMNWLCSSITSFDRIGNEDHRTIGHQDVDATLMST